MVNDNGNGGAVKTTLVYETATCGRCGGSGSHSYNQMHGSVCYGCSGRKIRQTKAGAKASKAVQAFIAANFSVKADALQVGDVIKYEGYVRTLTGVVIDAEARSSSTTNGVTTFYRYVHITFNKAVPTQFGPVGGAGLCEGQLVAKPVMDADWDRVIAFARTIKKGVTVVEKPEGGK